MSGNATVAQLHLKNFGSELLPSDLEGLGETCELSMSGYPLDSLLIRYQPRSVHEVFRLIEINMYIMNPDYQHDFVWDQKTQSRLIESMMMRIPLPVFYLAQRNNGKILVIDGLQRLMTITLYPHNTSPLDLNNGYSDLTGKYFKDLPIKLKNHIEDTKLLLYILEEKVPQNVKLDIFERVNSGIPLTRQQMRNSLFMGQATILLRDLAQSSDFLMATDYSLNAKSIRDREVINRFLAFSILGEDAYKGDMDQFLANALQKMNAMNTNELQLYSAKFLQSMRNNYAIWGQHAFRRHIPGKINRPMINIALFDVLSILFADKSESAVGQIKETAGQLLLNLENDPIFIESITLATNDVKRVKTRFSLARQAFKDVL